ncbi:MAG: glycogen debranching protein GlgX [Spirochaetes bacterium]|nr:glycogen debranching protein GlgX [Spirochaetota bacterium]
MFVRIKYSKTKDIFILMHTIKHHFVTLPGTPLPLGVHLDRHGARFALFSRHATAVSILLFASSETEEYIEIELDPKLNKTGDIWHIWIAGIREGQLYGYKVDGPYQPLQGHRFNKNKLLLDPYAKAISGNHIWDFSKACGYIKGHPDEDLSFSTDKNYKESPKCIVVDTEFDWYDRPIQTPMEDTIIYELHVKGFTYHPSSQVLHPGTYKGLAEKIPYLKELGVTAIELMPIQEFDEFENVNVNPFTGERLKNYWGYSTIAFFAPKSSYSSSGTMGQQINEFKEMIRDFHEAGIEVFLDVVFNHTAEGDHLGPTISFKGLDNSIYYMLKDNKRFYQNFSGCGNTVNCNNPLVRDFILDCLRYWVVDMHIDGFRFDLASILGRDQDGNILQNPPLIEKISEDPILRNTKIIAEAWDAGGAYLIGHFPGRWAEWNGKFRDDVRRFWRRDNDTVANFMQRIIGSPDIYQRTNRSPLHSINFITCHDGFTMLDLVSFNEKHNLENGEDNRDGDNNNLSYNWGVEGHDAPPEILKIRRQQIKNFFTTLLVSQGVPMILAGDEMGRTQNGNNNAYCQDNEISWVNWDRRKQFEDIWRFVQCLINFRKSHPVLRQKRFLAGTIQQGFTDPDCVWHGVNCYAPDLGYFSHSIALHLNGEYARLVSGTRDNDIYIIFNASEYDLTFSLPKPFNGTYWIRVVDTSLPSPDDITLQGTPIASQDSYLCKKMSSVVLISSPV